jgi:hypothetical protein
MGRTRIKARALVALGEVEEGLALGSAAVQLAKPTDWLPLRGWTQLHLATALQSVGRGDEAVDVARGAVAAYQAKGHLTGVRRAEAIRDQRRLKAGA